MPKDTPLLMKGPLVLQTLAGVKTQTRRVMNPQPASVEYWKAGQPTDSRNLINAVMRDEHGKG